MLSLGAAYGRETDRVVSMCVEEGRIPTRHPSIYTKGPEVFVRQDLFQKVNVDLETTGRTEIRPIYGACRLHQNLKIWAVQIFMVMVWKFHDDMLTHGRNEGELC